MAYSRRLAGRRTSLSAELMYLAIVLAAAVTTACWMGQWIGMDLSGIQTVLSLLGVDGQTASPPVVGYVPAQAPYCNGGQQPAFLNGMAALDRQAGSAMGTPVECEHVVSPGGDTLQQTTTGLAAYSKASNTVTFTDGWRHWALTSDGLVTWEGDSSSPPSASPGG